jgi:hypothetical protein
MTANPISPPAFSGAGAGLLLCLVTAAALVDTGCAQQPPRPAKQPAVIGKRPAQHYALKPVKQARAHAEKPTSKPVIRKDAPLEYVVKPGDTLWDIAAQFLRKPWLWPEIWYGNPQIANPHLIYPGDTLYLRYVNGKPRLQLQPGAVHLEPKVRRQPLKSAIHAIPMAAIRSFLHSPRVVERKTLDDAGYIVAFADRRVLGSQGNTAYATHLEHPPRQRYQIVHEGHAYRDPKTGKVLGYQAIPTAESELVSPGGDGTAAALKLTQSYQETAIGDRLLPAQAVSLRTGFNPHPPKNAVEGQIISIFHGLSETGRYHVVALDLGKSEGVDAGTVLGIYQPGGRVSDPHREYGGHSIQLPRIKAGVLMIFKTSGHVSHALIMDATRPIHVGDTVQSVRADSAS